jgi:hypothetical protein
MVLLILKARYFRNVRSAVALQLVDMCAALQLQVEGVQPWTNSVCAEHSHKSNFYFLIVASIFLFITLLVFPVQLSWSQV